MKDRPPNTIARRERRSARIDRGVAHASRVYDYLLGGGSNFTADREAAEHMTAVLPGGIDSARANARANRIFLGQAVRWLTGRQGVRQYLDIGAGIPAVHQTHQVAQTVAPEARVVYVDNDPIVLAHAHELLEGSDEGGTTFVQEDLRNPEAILDKAARTLDFTQPVGLVLAAVYHMIPDDDRPHDINAELLKAAPSGSYLVISHLTADFLAEAMTESVARLSGSTREQFVNRTRDEFARFADGLELVEPGIAQVDDWLRRGPLPPPPDVEPALPDDLDPRWVNPLWAAVGRKP